MDLLRDKELESRTSESVATSERDARALPLREGDGERRREVYWTGTRDADEEEEVVSLLLVGLGLQVHSKSYGARFSFSMQDLDLEVCRRSNFLTRLYVPSDGQTGRKEGMFCFVFFARGEGEDGGGGVSRVIYMGREMSRGLVWSAKSSIALFFFSCVAHVFRCTW